MKLSQTQLGYICMFKLLGLYPYILDLTSVSTALPHLHSCFNEF
jgi:hypothetical protein